MKKSILLSALALAVGTAAVAQMSATSESRTTSTTTTTKVDPKTNVTYASSSIVDAAEMDTKARKGIRFGLNASNLYVDQVTDRDPRYGFHASAFTQAPLINNFLYFQPEIGYTTKGMTARYNLPNTFVGQNSFNLDYIEGQTLMTFKIGNAVDLHAGAYGAYLVKAGNKNTNELTTVATTLNRDNFNKFDYGLSAGLSIYFGNFMVGTRYNHGLRPVANGTAANTYLGNSKNSVGQVTVGFTF